MNLFVVGLRRSGTTILYDALGEDRELVRFYEPLREDAETIGGGSGARAEDVFAETRALRERFRRERFPRLPAEQFNWGGPRAPELELDLGLPDHVAGLLRFLLAEGPRVAVKETRLQHKLPAIAAIDGEAAVVHLIRDPRAVCASMMLGRRRRTDIYPDADRFFTARTGRPLWSSRRISETLIARGGTPELPLDIPDFLRPLLVWKAAFESASSDGERCFGERFAQLRLEDLRAAPRAELERVYGLLGRSLPDAVGQWAENNVRPAEDLHLGEDPRWARAARLLGMERALDRAGYGEILELEPPGTELDLTPPPRLSPLFGLLTRARRRRRR